MNYGDLAPLDKLVNIFFHVYNLYNLYNLHYKFLSVIQRICESLDS